MIGASTAHLRKVQLTVPRSPAIASLDQVRGIRRCEPNHFMPAMMGIELGPDQRQRRLRVP